jgi:hypothetical protein
MCDLGRLISNFLNDMQKNIQCNLRKKLQFTLMQIECKELDYDYYIQNIFI